MENNLIIINSEIIEKESDGTMKRFIKIYFYDKGNDKVIVKTRLIEE